MNITPLIKQTAITSLAKLLSDGSTFEQVKLQVKIAEDPTKSGEQKKNAVIKALSTLGYTLSGFLLNLLIELSVAYYKVKFINK